MALPLWGELEKAQDNDQTIEEAIAAGIAAHEADSEAHLGSGESLQSHKSEEVIDHPPESLVADKYQPGSVDLSALTSTRRLIFWNCVNSDGFLEDTGTYFYAFGNATARTPATTNTYAGISDDPSNWVGFDPSKYALWQSTIRFTDDSNLNATWGYGTAARWAGDDIGFGFRWDNGTFKIWMGYYPSGGGTFYTETTLTSPNIELDHVYRIIYDPDTPAVNFFIDGELVGQFTSDLPDSAWDNKFILSTKTLSNAYRYAYISDFLFTIDR